MRALVHRLSSMLLAGSVCVAACGDDGGTEAQSQFNEFEALQVLNAAFNAIETVDEGPSGSAAAVQDFSATRNCANGGTAAVVGSHDPAPAIVDFDARVTYTNCANASVTLNGFIDVTATSVNQGGSFQVTWTFVGTVSSRKDGRTRSCTMDVTRVRTLTSGSISTTTSGSVCGRTVSA